MVLRVGAVGKFSRDARLLDADTDGKLCTGCGEFKPWGDFYRKHSRCKPCVVVQTNEDRKSIPGWGAIRQAASRAKAKNLPFDLYEYKELLFARFKNGCELTGLSFDFSVQGKGGAWNSPSIDRVKPELGYVYTNVRLVLWSLNMAFSNWGEDNFEIAARAWLERKDR